MRSRRSGDVSARSPPAKTGDRRSEWRSAPYSPCRDAREDRPKRSRRSLSPPELERSRRVLGKDRRSSSVERRERPIDGVCYDHGSSPFRQSRNWSQFDGSIPRRDSPSIEFQRKYQFAELTDFSGVANPSLEKIGGYGLTMPTIGKDKDSQGNGVSALDGHGMLVQKSMSLKDGTLRKFFASPSDGHIGETSSSSRNLKIDFLDDRDRYYGRRLPDKLSGELYKEDIRFYSNNASYHMVPMTQSNTFGSASSGIPKSDSLVSYRDGLPLPSDGEGRSCEKLKAPFGYNGYSKALYFDSVEGPEVWQKDMTSYQQRQLNQDRVEHDDYIYAKRERKERGNPGYMFDELCRKMPPQLDYSLGDSSRQSIMDRIVVGVDKAESLKKNPRETSLWDHCSLRENPVSDSFNMSRTSYGANDNVEFFGSRDMDVDFGKKVSRNHEILRSAENHGFGRDAGPACYRERLKSPPMADYDPKMYRLDMTHRESLRAEELGIYDQPERVYKRKYSMDEEMYRHSSRTTNRNTSGEFNRRSDIDEKWTDEEMGRFSVPGEFASSYSHCRRTGRAFDGTFHHRLSASDDQLMHIQGDSIEFRKPGAINIKRRLRPAPQKFSNPYHLDRRHDFHKSFKFWKRSRPDYYGAIHVPDGESSEDLGAPLKSDPPEDSEEFQQLVCRAFFKFIKQLNETPVQRRRYKEQTVAGNLICSVCSSLLKYSKEFMDTRSLAAHAYMSLKVGLRSQHLGLHKALCVLMGWSSVAAPGSTWHPQILSDAEVLALKNDLILWPPLIIIHNSSITSNNPDGRNVVTIEALEAILRGMGFGAGKTKVCRGKPANQSTMVVKFKGTFSGLQEADKLHNYYVENKHGRAEFEQIGSSGRDNAGGRESHADKPEHILYGYMGIVEDLDKLDFETKKRCLVKSKKEIQEIADAPLETE